MKAVEKKEAKGFQPIEITITIESEDELRMMWHRMNVSKNTVLSASDESCVKHPSTNCSTYQLFSVLDDITIARGIQGN